MASLSSKLVRRPSRPARQTADINTTGRAATMRLHPSPRKAQTDFRYRAVAGASGGRVLAGEPMHQGIFRNSPDPSRSVDSANSVRGRRSLGRRCRIAP